MITHQYDESWCSYGEGSGGAVVTFAKHTYDREEDFLQDFEPLACIVAAHLAGAWVPVTWRDRPPTVSQTSGRLRILTFHCGTVLYSSDGFDSLRLHLRAPGRDVHVQVNRAGLITIEGATSPLDPTTP